MEADKPAAKAKVDPKIAAWEKATIKRFAETTDMKAFFALVDEIREKREWLHVNVPEVDHRIGVAAKAASARLSPVMENAE
jgi:hypothetical protein